MVDQGLCQSSALPELASACRIGHGDGPAGLTVREVQGLAMVSMIARKGRRAELAAAILQKFGAALPTTPSRVAGEAIAFLWAGPDQWLAIATLDAHTDLERELGASIGAFASLTDQGDGRTVISVSGPASRDVLATGVPLDLHPRAFKPGDVALAHANHIAVTFWQIDDAPTYEFAVARGYARSFWTWLRDAGARYGIDIVG